MITPEIKDLIQPLEQYMTPDQKAQLKKILSIGESWNKDADALEEHFRDTHTRNDFVNELSNYYHKKQRRESDHQQLLQDIGYDKMTVVEKHIFEKQFIEKLITYTLYPDIPEQRKKITKDEFMVSGLKSGSSLDLSRNKIGVEDASAIQNTGGFKSVSYLDLEHNQIGD